MGKAISVRYISIRWNSIWARVRCVRGHYSALSCQKSHSPTLARVLRQSSKHEAKLSCVVSMRSNIAKIRASAVKTVVLPWEREVTLPPPNTDFQELPAHVVAFHTQIINSPDNTTFLLKSSEIKDIVFFQPKRGPDIFKLWLVLPIWCCRPVRSLFLNPLCNVEYAYVTLLDL
jgi:hypothetical protein